MLLSLLCRMPIPMEVKLCDFFDPNGYLASSFAICSWKYSSPPWMPSSTWTRSAPDSFPDTGCRGMYKHGSTGQGVKCTVQFQQFFIEGLMGFLMALVFFRLS